jgi:hypothetical protein
MRSALVILLAAALALSAGCGGGGKDDSAGDDGKFRVPDSLLSPIEGYGLLVDDYHPVNGGVMANADIEVHYPPQEVARFIAVKAFGEILRGYRTVVEEIGRPVDGKVVIIGAKDLDEYRVMTRKEWWYYAWVKGDTIYSEPLKVLLKRWDPITGKTLVEIGLTQRIAQLALDGLSNGRIPIWMKEAAASFVAGERPVLHQQIYQFTDVLEGYSPTIDELENHILAGTDMQESRLAYFFVFRMLENLLEKYEFASVPRFASRLGEGASLDDASNEEFGMSYAELIAAVRPADILDGAGPLDKPTLNEGTQ